MRKLSAILLPVMLILFVFAGCSSQAAVTTQQWAVEIIESDGIGTEIGSSEIQDIKIIEIEAVLEKEDGSKTEEKWKGIKLADLLNKAGIKEYSTVAVEASDGYSKEFDANTINDDGTILGLVKDGKELTEGDGLPRLVVKTMHGSAWIKNVAKIKVIE